MPGLLSRVTMSARAKRRFRVASVAMLAIVAALSWWMVADEGPSPARLIAAIVTSVAALLELLLPRRRRLFRRSGTPTGGAED